MAKGFFITGTDTAVGKTVVSAAVIRAMNMLGLKPFGMKPVESGVTRTGDVLVPSDGSFLKWAAMMDENVNHVTPFCLETPLAPMVAAELEDVDIDIGVIKREFDLLMGRYGSAVVEGVGGLLVPIKEGYFVSDLARDLGLPLIVVSRPVLGTINHTLLTVNYALKEGIGVSGVIINYNRPPDGTLSEETNPKVLGKLLSVPVFGVFPFLREMSMESIDKAVIKNLDIGAIKKALEA